MKCSKCQFGNPEGARFCIECGQAMEFRCPKCGAITSAKGNFCMECGHSLGVSKEATKIDYSAPQSYTPKHLADKILTTRTSIEGERKLVTVLFADVANFTNLSSKLDPEEVHQIMDGCFRILMDEIHKYEGTINQFTGDGVMALFGAPVAHEDHAQRACHAALAIQKAMTGYGDKIEKEYGVEFKMRIGLNSGPVIVGSIGDDLRMDYTAVGNTTNLASRMESAAKPESILVTRNTHRLVRDFFEFESLGAIEVKGKDEHQEAFQLIGVGGASTRIEAAVARGLTKFVGRQNSMAALMEAYEKVKRGSGQLVGVVGEAGVGKSRLLFEFRNRLPKEEFTYLEGRCIHFGGNMPYLPILDILRSYFGIVEGEREVQVRKRISEGVLGLDQKLAHVIPPIQEILSLRVEDEDYLKLDPKTRRERVFEALRDLLVTGSQVRPLVLAVEDLHWIDKTTEEFLNYFIGWTANLKVMLVLLHRPEYTHQWGNKSYFNRIGVDQLTMQSSAELVKAILEGGEAAPELKDLILKRAAGNPFFMEELTHTLLENGSILKEDNQYVLARTASQLQVPDTVQGIIAARIDRLEENLKRIMQVASVIGREFAFRILQSIADMKADLKTQLLNLQGLEFIYEKNLFPELEYIFKHALTQEVAYNSLLAKRRKEIHEKIGNAIEQLYAERLEEFYEMLAYHYSKGENLRKTCDYAKLAGDKSGRLSSHWEAFDFYKNAIESLDKMPTTKAKEEEKLGILFLAGNALAPLGFPEGSLEILQEREKLAGELGDSRSLARTYSSISNYHSHRGNAQLGLKYSTYAFEEALKNQDIEVMAHSAMSLAVAYTSTGDFLKIVDFAPGVIDLIEKKKRKPDFFLAAMNPYSVLCMYYCISMANLGNFDEGKAISEKALRNSLEIKDTLTLGPIELMSGLLFSTKGDWELAIVHLQKCIEHSEAVNFLWISGIAGTCLGRAYAMMGDPEAGKTHVKNGLEIHRNTGVTIHLPYACYVSSFTHLELGDLESARSLAEEALRLSQDGGERNIEGQSMILLGKILGISVPSKLDEPKECILKGIQILKAMGARPSYSLGYLFLGEIDFNAGKADTARENLMTAEGMFQEMGMDYWLNRTRGILARL